MDVTTRTPSSEPTSQPTILGASPLAAGLAQGLLAVMVVQSVAGVSAPHLYNDVDWIRATWYGNDGITLLLACPLLLMAVSGARLDLPRWQVLRIGLVGYAVYNYAFYLFGAALNPFFLVYVVAFVVAIGTLVATLGAVRIGSMGTAFSARTPVRLLAGYMLAVACGLSIVWAGTWARYIFAGDALPAAPEVFRLVAALDLSFMVPALTLGGLLLWKRHDWGFAISSVALVQAALYLLVLSVNSLIAIARGLVPWPGELLLWAPLCLPTTLAALVLVACAQSPRQAGQSPTLSTTGSLL